jgi:hypothetical protein
MYLGALSLAGWAPRSAANGPLRAHQAEKVGETEVNVKKIKAPKDHNETNAISGRSADLATGHGKMEWPDARVGAVG